MVNYHRVALEEPVRNTEKSSLQKQILATEQLLAKGSGKHDVDAYARVQPAGRHKQKKNSFQKELSMTTRAAELWRQRAPPAARRVVEHQQSARSTWKCVLRRNEGIEEKSIRKLE